MSTSSMTERALGDDVKGKVEVESLYADGHTEEVEKSKNLALGEPHRMLDAGFEPQIKKTLFSATLPSFGSIVLASFYGEEEGILIAADRKMVIRGGGTEYHSKLYLVRGQIVAGTGNSAVVSHVIGEFTRAEPRNVDAGAAFIRRQLQDVNATTNFTGLYATKAIEFLICGVQDGRPVLRLIFCDQYEPLTPFIVDDTWVSAALGSGSDYVEDFFNPEMPRATFEELWQSTKVALRTAIENDPDFCGGSFDRAKVTPGETIIECNILTEEQLRVEIPL